MFCPAIFVFTGAIHPYRHDHTAVAMLVTLHLLHKGANLAAELVDLVADFLIPFHLLPRAFDLLLDRQFGPVLLSGSLID